jgi:hypothetical protein
MKTSNDIIGNRTRNLPACSAVPQPTAPPVACSKQAQLRVEMQKVSKGLHVIQKRYWQEVMGD